VPLGLDVPLGLIWLGVCTHIAAPAQVSSWHYPVLSLCDRMSAAGRS